MKRIFVGLLVSVICFMTQFAVAQPGSTAGVNGHSEFVVRFEMPQLMSNPDFPVGTTILSKHEPMNILVVKNDRTKDETFAQLLHHVSGVVRVETASYDEAGKAVYPTGIAILDPASDYSRGVQYCKDKGCTVTRELGSLGWFAVLLPTELSYASFSNDAKESGIFTTIMRDEIIEAHTTVSNDPLYSSCWYVSQVSDKDIDADLAWSAMPTSATVKSVSVIDGHGFDTTHPDMAGNWSDTYNAVNQTTNVMPENAFDKHGTPCAGIPGAEYDNATGTPGLGSDLLQVQAIKIGYNIQSGGTFFTSSLIEADAINRAISVSSVASISMSFGSTSYQTAFFNAITSARTTGRGGKGILVFASTGNSGLTTWTNYPASYSGVIAVGSSTSSDSRSSFSNYSTGLTLAAPGSGVTTIDVTGSAGYSSNDYTSFSGTSAACPVAASVGAMVIAANPDLTEAEGKAIMATSCEKVGGYSYTSNGSQPLSTWSSELGYGRVNMLNAVNGALGTATDPAVDITIASVLVNDNTPNVGQSIAINCSQVISLSTTNAASVTLEYRWSTDQTWSTSDVLIGTDVSTLGGGISSEAESITYIVPAGTGTRYILIKCDATNVLSESNESNNVTVVPVTVSTAIVLADITIANYSVTDNTPTVGQNITINCQQLILNASLSSSNVILEYRYSTDAVWSTNDVLIGKDTSALGLLLTFSNESINYTIPAGTGTRYVLIKADVTNVISESNESNNVYSISMSVSNSTTTPDVTVSNLNANSSAVTIGQSVNVSCIQTINNGPASPVAVTLQYRWSTDAVWSTSDAVLGSDTSILGGSTSWESESITIIVPSGTGTRYLLAKADFNNTVTESSETNNTAVYSLTVSAVPNLTTDVTLSGLSSFASALIAGQSITVSCSQNVVDGPSGITFVTLLYRWSTDASWSTDDVILGADTSVLGSGITSNAESHTFTIPAGAGLRYILIMADAGNAIAESDESNVYAIPVTVTTVSLPDVFVDALTISAETAAPGQSLSVSCSQNISIATGSSVNVFMEYRWGTGTTWSNGYPLVGIDFSPLGNGNAGDPESLTFTVPVGTGQRYLLIRSDSNNGVAESDETNNYVVIPVMITTSGVNGMGDEEQAGANSVILEEEMAEEALQVSFNVYPNPVRDILNIQLAAMASQAVSYEIRSMNGALVESSSIGEGSMSKTVDVSQLEGGIYFLSMAIEGETIVQRIVVTH